MMPRHHRSSAIARLFRHTQSEESSLTAYPTARRGHLPGDERTGNSPSHSCDKENADADRSFSPAELISKLAHRGRTDGMKYPYADHPADEQRYERAEVCGQANAAQTNRGQRQAGRAKQP